MGSPKVENILVWLPNPVGDVVMATPSLRAIREHFGDAAITYVGRAPALAVMAGTGWATTLVEDRSTMPPKLTNARRLIKRLKEGGYDLGILLPNSFRSALLAHFGRVRRLVGYARPGRGWMLDVCAVPQTDAAGRRKPVPTIDQYRGLLDAIGVPCDSRRMELPADPEGDRQAEALLAEAGSDPERPIVMLNPGSGFGPSKRWPAGRFAAVADSLAERRGAQIVINAAPSERRTAADVADAMRHAPLINLADVDNTIGLVKGLVRRSALAITNDTGLRHIAAAFDVPVVTVFGSTDPVWAQIDYERERILRVDVPCSPCQEKHCVAPPGVGFHECMAAISPAMVLGAAEELLDAARTGQWAQGSPAPQAPEMGELLRGHGLDSIEGVFEYGGGDDFHKPGLGGRQRTRLELVGDDGRTHVLYLKRYAAQPMRSRLWRLLTTGRVEGPALVERRNIMLAEAAGVPTMRAVAGGEQPGGGRGYVIVTEVPGDALERCGNRFLQKCEGSPDTLAEFTRSLARLVRRLHETGYVHRDLYASHVFLDEAAGAGAMHLIDLARMFRPRWRKFRWRVKDLAQLHYSMPGDWVDECWTDFMREYLGPDRSDHAARWQRAIRRKVARIRRHARKKGS